MLSVECTLIPVTCSRGHVSGLYYGSADGARLAEYQLMPKLGTYDTTYQFLTTFSNCDMASWRRYG